MALTGVKSVTPEIDDGDQGQDGGHDAGGAGEEGQAHRGVRVAAAQGEAQESLPRRPQAPGPRPRRAGDGAAGMTLLREPTIETTAAVSAPVNVPTEKPREALHDSVRVYPFAVVREAFGTTVSH